MDKPLKVYLYKGGFNFMGNFYEEIKKCKEEREVEQV